MRKDGAGITITNVDADSVTLVAGDTATVVAGKVKDAIEAKLDADDPKWTVTIAENVLTLTNKDRKVIENDPAVTVTGSDPGVTCTPDNPTEGEAPAPAVYTYTIDGTQANGSSFTVSNLGSETEDVVVSYKDIENAENAADIADIVQGKVDDYLATLTDAEWTVDYTDGNAYFTLTAAEDGVVLAADAPVVEVSNAEASTLNVQTKPGTEGEDSEPAEFTYALTGSFGADTEIEIFGLYDDDDESTVNVKGSDCDALTLPALLDELKAEADALLAADWTVSIDKTAKTITFTHTTDGEIAVGNSPIITITNVGVSTLARTVKENAGIDPKYATYTLTLEGALAEGDYVTITNLGLANDFTYPSEGHEAYTYEDLLAALTEATATTGDYYVVLADSIPTANKLDVKLEARRDVTFTNAVDATVTLGGDTTITAETVQTYEGAAKAIREGFEVSTEKRVKNLIMHPSQSIDYTADDAAQQIADWFNAYVDEEWDEKIPEDVKERFAASYFDASTKNPRSDVKDADITAKSDFGQNIEATGSVVASTKTAIENIRHAVKFGTDYNSNGTLYGLKAGGQGWVSGADNIFAWGESNTMKVRSASDADKKTKLVGNGDFDPYFAKAGSYTAIFRYEKVDSGKTESAETNITVKDGFRNPNVSIEKRQISSFTPDGLKEALDIDVDMCNNTSSAESFDQNTYAADSAYPYYKPTTEGDSNWTVKYIGVQDQGITFIVPINGSFTLA